MIREFDAGVRVMLVKRADGPNLFGVAMAHGRYVVPLPRGYDGLTELRWVSGWIIVSHPTMPPLLADTTTGKTAPMNDQALAAALHDYQAPKIALAR
jgi:hypothetical protein